VSYSIFLSHSAQDLDLVSGIKAQVEAVGIHVYLYEEHTSPGEALTPHLQRAITDQDALVALLTPNSAPRSYVQQEIGFALGRGKPAVALVAPGVRQESLAMLSDRTYIQLDPADPLHGMAELLRDLRDRAGRKQQQDELVTAVVLIGLLLILAYSASQPAKG
jgi:nucleoside 2-deoxyribosyltransferase